MFFLESLISLDFLSILLMLTTILLPVIALPIIIVDLSDIFFSEHKSGKTGVIKSKETMQLYVGILILSLLLLTLMHTVGLPYVI